MTDINFSRPPGDPDSKGAEARALPRGRRIPLGHHQLLFFAYRDFVGDADHELEAFGFGRAITGHAFRPPLSRPQGRDLLTCCVSPSSRSAACSSNCWTRVTSSRRRHNDRRQRLLYATPKGEPWWRNWPGCRPTASPARSARSIPPALRHQQFLRAMIDRDDPDKVLEAIFGTGKNLGSNRGQAATIASATARAPLKPPTTPRICCWSTTTAASAICCRAFFR